MAAPSAPTNFQVQQANQQILISWSMSVGATSYIIQRSLDNVTYSTLTTISGSPLATSYLDTAVTLGTQYWYKVSADNGENSGYTLPLSAVPAPTGEMTLSQLRLAAQQRADRVNSPFVTNAEWRSYINQAMFELYDLLITTYEDYYMATPVQFQVNGTSYLYPLPNGSNTFMNGLNPSQTFIPKPFYKLLGVDLSISTASNAYVTINKFNFADRNKWVYPNTASTIYGVFNMQYRVLGSNIEFLPTPSGGQYIRLWYIPRLTELLQETDTTDIGISGWLEYVIVRAAKYALDKEESDSSRLAEEILFLKQRIEESAANRDAGMPDTISNTRPGPWSNGWGGGNGGPTGGWALAPVITSYDITNSSLSNSIFSSYSLLTYIALAVNIAYFCYLFRRELGLTVLFARIRDLISSSLSTFSNHISHIVGLSPKKQMIRINASRVITPMTHVQAVYRPNKQFIGNSRSVIPFAFDGKQASIAVGVQLTSPKPTRVSFINFIKKSIYNRLHISSLLKAYYNKLKLTRGKK